PDAQAVAVARVDDEIAVDFDGTDDVGVEIAAVDTRGALDTHGLSPSFGRFLSEGRPRDLFRSTPRQQLSGPQPRPECRATNEKGPLAEQQGGLFDRIFRP